MRFTRNLSGLKRIRTNGAYKRNIEYISPKKEETSNDTIARWVINSKIIEMLEQNKGDIEIEIYLREKYPNYAEYIPKMIVHHSSKLRAKTTENNKQKEVGDAR